MKKFFLTTALLLALVSINCKNTNAKTDTSITQNSKKQTTVSFGVRGNCEMCKATIEKAASNIEGVTKAQWDKNTKQITISFDAHKTNIKALHHAIANAGYDTDTNKANQKAYAELPGCCQYKRDMPLGTNTDVENTHDMHKGHNH